MQKLVRYLGVDYEAVIKKSIEEAEAKTSAEIVPMIVSSSTLARHVFPTLLLLFLLISSEVYHILPIDLFYPLSPAMVFVGLIVLSLSLAYVFSKSNLIKRAFTSDAEELLNVERRALNEFYLAHMTSTISKTGILLFLLYRSEKLLF